MGGPQAGPYTAHSGSTPRRPSLSGRKTSQPAEPSTSARSSSIVTNGMSQATARTGPGAAGTAGERPPPPPRAGPAAGAAARTPPPAAAPGTVAAHSRRAPGD